jgi:hypothetical protein
MSKIKIFVFTGASYSRYVLYKACTTKVCPFSYKDLAGKLYEMGHGGPYTVKLTATGGGTQASDQKTFSVDNTPSVTVAAPVDFVISPFDITGNIIFKPTLNATKGYIHLHVNGYYVVTKSCTTESRLI